MTSTADTAAAVASAMEKNNHAMWNNLHSKILIHFRNLANILCLTVPTALMIENAKTFNDFKTNKEGAHMKATLQFLLQFVQEYQKIAEDAGYAPGEAIEVVFEDVHAHNDETLALAFRIWVLKKDIANPHVNEEIAMKNLMEKIRKRLYLPAKGRGEVENAPEFLRFTDIKSLPHLLKIVGMYWGCEFSAEVRKNALKAALNDPSNILNPFNAFRYEIALQNTPPMAHSKFRNIDNYVTVSNRSYEFRMCDTGHRSNEDSFQTDVPSQCGMVLEPQDIDTEIIMGRYLPSFQKYFVNPLYEKDVRQSSHALNVQDTPQYLEKYDIADDRIEAELLMQEVKAKSLRTAMGLPAKDHFLKDRSNFDPNSLNFVKIEKSKMDLQDPQAIMEQVDSSVFRSLRRKNEELGKKLETELRGLYKLNPKTVDAQVMNKIREAHSQRISMFCDKALTRSAHMCERTKVLLSNLLNINMKHAPTYEMIFNDLGLYANCVIRDIEHFDKVWKVYSCHIPLFTLLVGRYDTYRYSNELHFNVLLLGQNSTSKSFGLDTVERVTPGANRITSQTKRADAVAKDNNDILKMNHEFPIHEYTTDSDLTNALKDILTKMSIVILEFVRDEESKERTNKISKSECIGCHFYASNALTSTVDAALLTRFLIIFLAESVTDVRSLGAVKLAEDLEGSAEAMERQNLDNEWRWKCLMHFLVEKMIESRVLTDVSMDIFPLLVEKAQNILASRGRKRLHVRTLERAKILARHMVIDYMLIRVFCTEASPARNLISEDALLEDIVSSIVQHGSPHLFCTFEIMVLAMSMISIENENPDEQIVKDKLFELYRNNPQHKSERVKGVERTDESYFYVDSNRSDLVKELFRRMDPSNRPSMASIDKILEDFGSRSITSHPYEVIGGAIQQNKNAPEKVCDISASWHKGTIFHMSLIHETEKLYAEKILRIICRLCRENKVVWSYHRPHGAARVSCDIMELQRFVDHTYVQIESDISDIRKEVTKLAFSEFGILQQQVDAGFEFLYRQVEKGKQYEMREDDIVEKGDSTVSDRHVLLPTTCNIICRNVENMVLLDEKGVPKIEMARRLVLYTKIFLAAPRNSHVSHVVSAIIEANASVYTEKRTYLVLEKLSNRYPHICKTVQSVASSSTNEFLNISYRGEASQRLMGNNRNMTMSSGRNSNLTIQIREDTDKYCMRKHLERIMAPLKKSFMNTVDPKKFAETLYSAKPLNYPDSLIEDEDRKAEAHHRKNNKVNPTDDDGDDDDDDDALAEASSSSFWGHEKLQVFEMKLGTEATSLDQRVMPAVQTTAFVEERNRIQFQRTTNVDSSTRAPAISPQATQWSQNRENVTSHSSENGSEEEEPSSDAVLSETEDSIEEEVMRQKTRLTKPTKHHKASKVQIASKDTRKKERVSLSDEDFSSCTSDDSEPRSKRRR
eukprot:ANDGO_01909.mRNA.1 hypothetical protein